MQFAGVHLTFLILWLQMVPNELHAVFKCCKFCPKDLFTLPDPGWNGHCKSHWSSVNSCFSHPWCSIFLHYSAHALIAVSIHSHIRWVTLSLFLLCVCVALVVPAAELEQLGGYSPGVHGLPHLRWGQSAAAEVHPQAWQVRQKHMYMRTDMHLVMQSTCCLNTRCGVIRFFSVWVQWYRRNCQFLNTVWIGSALTVTSQWLK